MALLTAELLQQKLTTWVPSSQIHLVLGFSNEQEAEVKSELVALCELGILAREGQKRSLKYRLASITDDNITTADDQSSSEESNTNFDVHSYKRTKDALTESTKKKSFYELISWITNAGCSSDSSITSLTVAIKKFSDGSIALRTYAGVVLLHEETFSTPKAFHSFVSKSISPKEVK